LPIADLPCDLVINFVVLFPARNLAADTTLTCSWSSQMDDTDLNFYGFPYGMGCISTHKDALKGIYLSLRFGELS
jgi:hypothetical protein